MGIDKEKMIKIASIIIGLIIAVLVIWIGLRIVQRSKAFDLTASDIQATNLTQNSFDLVFKAPSGLHPVAYFGIDNTNLIATVGSSRELGGGLVEYTIPITGQACDQPIKWKLSFGDKQVDCGGVDCSTTLPCSSSTNGAEGVTPTAAATQTPVPPSPTASTASPTQKPISECCRVNGVIPEGCNTIQALKCEGLVPTATASAN